MHHYRPYKEGDVVYLMRRANGDLKIGKSCNADTRRRYLQCLMWEWVVLLYTVPGYTELEAELHERFTRYRLPAARRNGRRLSEWFSPAPEIYQWFIEHGQEWTGSNQPNQPPTDLQNTQPCAHSSRHKHIGYGYSNTETFEWWGCPYCEKQWKSSISQREDKAS